MGEYNIAARRGDDLALKFTCKNGSSAFDLTGSTMVFKVIHENGSITLSTVDDTLTMDAPATGIVEGTLTDEQITSLPLGAVARYELDRIIDGKSKTLMWGKIVVSEGFS